MYAAFGRGDIPGILSHLTENVDWRVNVDPAAPGAKAVPILRAFRGRNDVQEFFAIIGRELEFHSFTPVSFLAGDNQVAAHVRMEWTMRKTGQRAREEAMHLFTFNEKGQVSQFREFTDTLLAAAVWGAVQEKR
jgi:ketosteroid isomerase-like protein